MSPLFLLTSLLLLLGPQAIIFYSYFDARLSFVGFRTYLLYEMFMLFLYAQLPASSGLIIEQIMELLKPPLNILFMVWALTTFNDSRLFKSLSPRKCIFYTGLGWSVAHNVTNYLFPLILSLWKEFDWRYIEMGVWSQMNFYKFFVYAILAMRCNVGAWDPSLTIPHALCGITMVAESFRPLANRFLPNSFNWIYFVAGCTILQLVCTVPWLASAGRVIYKAKQPATQPALETPSNKEMDKTSNGEKITNNAQTANGAGNQQHQVRRRSKANKKKKKRRY